MTPFERLVARIKQDRVPVEGSLASLLRSGGALFDPRPMRIPFSVAPPKNYVVADGKGGFYGPSLGKMDS